MSVFHTTSRANPSILHLDTDTLRKTISKPNRISTEELVGSDIEIRITLRLSTGNEKHWISTDIEITLRSTTDDLFQTGHHADVSGTVPIPDWTVARSAPVRLVEVQDTNESPTCNSWESFWAVLVIWIGLMSYVLSAAKMIATNLLVANVIH